MILRPPAYRFHAPLPKGHEVPANSSTVEISTPTAVIAEADTPPATPAPAPAATRPVAEKTPVMPAIPKEISPMPKAKKRKAVVKAKKAVNPDYSRSDRDLASDDRLRRGRAVG